MLNTLKKNWEEYLRAVQECEEIQTIGHIIKIRGIIAEADGPKLSVGSICNIINNKGKLIPAEVVGFKERKIIVMPYGDMEGIEPGSPLIFVKESPSIMVGYQYLGRVIDGLGNPLDGKGPLWGDKEYPLYSNSINPLKRAIIREYLDVGIRSINSLFTIGKGQRIAIMAGSGVGKSVLMGMMVRNTKADVRVVALIGERGREVKEFLENNLNDETRAKSVLVVATSDSPALIRIRAAYLATAISEYFRDMGKDVLLIMDSITRFAMALREVGLAIGEPPSSKGYTPSVFSILPKILERAGSIEGKGSITGIYNVLIEADDINDPIGDAIRSIVDGHIVLSRELANRGHYPAVDILKSISRLMPLIVDKEHREYAKRLINIVSIYKDAEDLINIGAYKEGSNPEIDYAIKMMNKIEEFLKQNMEESSDMKDSITKLKSLFKD